MSTAEIIIIYLSLGLIFLFLILATITLYINKMGSKKKFYISNKVFVVDHANKLVKYFDKKYLKSISSISFNAFFLFFDSESKKNVTNLIEKALTEQIALPMAIEVDSYYQPGSKRIYRALLEVTSVNSKRELVHLNLYYFKHLPLLSQPDKKILKRDKKTYNLTSYDIDREFRFSLPYSGASYMFNITAMLHINSVKFNNFIFYSFYDILAKHSNDKSIAKLSPTLYVVYDFKTANRIGFLKYINTIRKEFKMVLDLNQLSEYARLNIAVVEHKFFPNNYILVMKHLKQLMNDVVNSNKPYAFYDIANQNTFYFDPSLKNEAQAIILGHEFSYVFEPVLDTKLMKVIGYNAYVKTSSKIFADFHELKQYASTLDLGNKLFIEFVKSIAQKSSSELYSAAENKNDIIFYYSIFDELDVALRNLKIIGNLDNINLCFVFDEDEILKNLTSEEIINKFHQLSAIKPIGLIIKEQNVVLPDNLVSLFSYFVFISPRHSDAKSSSHDSFILRKSVEKIIKWRKIIVLKDVQSIQDIEVRLQSGLRYLSGPAIGERNEMFLPVSQKVIDRIEKIQVKKRE